ncbi:aldolase [Virgibacillus sp. W0181]|uniref:aldolase n=1 Tax=Virgibacillus sp. W0181 TaxID=3391581 RepID=UPI003F48421F
MGNGPYIYKAFGLTIASEFYLPELVAAENRSTVDLVIEKRNLTSVWEKVKQDEKRFLVHDNICYFEVPGLAIYSIEDGKRICVTPLMDAEEDRIRIYLLSSCMAAVLIQRQILPMHGSAIEIDGKAYGIVGRSGAGKSTIASAFLQKGFRLISDDLLPITFTEANTPVITPAFPHQKLWEESLHNYELDTNHYQPLVRNGRKYAIPVNQQFVNQPLPLHGIIELVKTEEPSIDWNPVNKFERLRLLYKHTFRKSILFQYDLIEWHFEAMSKLSNQITIHQIKRPTNRFTPYELADIVLHHIKTGGERENEEQFIAPSIR